MKNKMFIIITFVVAVISVFSTYLMSQYFKGENTYLDETNLGDMKCVITSGPVRVYGYDGGYTNTSNCSLYKKTGDCYERAGTTDVNNCGSDNGLDCYVWRKYHVECTGVCERGTYLTKDNECKSCPIDSYCPGGDNGKKISCSDGKTNQYGTWTTNGEGKSSANDCILSCPAGRYSSSNLSTAECKPCESGNYCPGGTSGQIQCKENGYTKSNALSTKKEDCYMYVEAGYGINETYKDKTKCEGNTYYPTSRDIHYGSISKCIECNGKVNESHVSCTEYGKETVEACYCNTNKSVCVWQKGGSSAYPVYQDNVKSKDECNKLGKKSCDPGFYSVDNKNCLACEAGYYCPGGLSGRTICPKNSYCPGKSSKPTACSAGKTNQYGTWSTNGEGKKSANDCVLSCPAGRYSTSNLNSAECKPCESGYYCPGGTSGQVQCKENGYTKSNASSSKKEDCYMYVEAGYGVSVKNKDKTKCEDNTYFPSGRNVHYGSVSLCIDCIGTVNESRISCTEYGKEAIEACYCNADKSTCIWQKGGSAAYPRYEKNMKTKDECQGTGKKTCDSGYYLSDDNTCHPCEAGYYCPGGIRDRIICPKNSYCPEKSSNPTACSVGKTNQYGTWITDKEGKKSANDCVLSCPAGRYSTSNLNSAECKPCENGYYCLGGTRGMDQCPSPYSNSHDRSKSINDCYMYVEAGYGVSEKNKDKAKCEGNTYFPIGREAYYGNKSECYNCTGKVDNNKITCSSVAYKACYCNPSTTSCSWQVGGSSVYPVIHSGVYNENECNSLEKKICSVGYYSPDNKNCIPCDAGYYCVGGISDKTNCPSGYSYSDPMAKKKEDCYAKVGSGRQIKTAEAKIENCGESYFYPEERKVYFGQVSTCIRCIGIVNSEKTECDFYGTVAQEACYCNPTGTSCNWQKGGTSSYPVIHNGVTKDKCSAEEKCIAGYYKTTSGCKPCENGYYCLGGTRGMDQCPSPYSSSHDRAKSQNDCYMYVEAGYGVDEIYKDKNKCSGNTYFPVAREVYYGNISKCLNCEGETDKNNVYCTDFDKIAVEACYCNPTKSSCTWQVGGTSSHPVYINATKTECNKIKAKTCEAGYYLSTDGECLPCKGGNYCPGGPNGMFKCPSLYPESQDMSTKETDCYANVKEGMQIKISKSKVEDCGDKEYYPRERKVYYGEISKCYTCTGTVDSNKTTCINGVYGCFCNPKRTSCSWRTSGTAAYPEYYANKTEIECNNMQAKTCEAGYYLKLDGKCSPCISGNYCPGGESDMIKCPSPYDNSPAKATKIEDCYAYVEAGMQIKEKYDVVKSCDENEYIPGSRNVNYGNVSKCLPCDGVVNSNRTSCDEVTVPVCKEGEYLNNNQCDLCPGIYNKSQKGATSINQCYTEITGQEILEKYGDATDCKAGTYSSFKRVYFGSISSCSSCKGKTYSSAKASKCLPCDGEVNDDHTECNNGESRACNEGEYLENNICKTCPAGYEKSPTSATSIKDCFTVIEGQEITKAYALATDCKIGTYNSSVKVNYGNTSLCKACTDKKTTSYEGAKDASECNVCISGYRMTSSNNCVKKSGISYENDACYRTGNKMYVYGKYQNIPGYEKVSNEISNCNKLELEKISDDNKELLGAKVLLKKLDKNNNVLSKKEYTIGKESIEMLEPGNYLLEEVSAPTNYQLIKDAIELKVGLDGTIYANSNNIILKSNNLIRNVSLSVINKLANNNAADEDDDKKCFVKYGKGEDNKYCIGTDDDCTGYEEISKAKCDEITLCYQKKDGTYNVGKFENQSDYTYYGETCPACYLNSDEYRYWTSKPGENDKMILSITEEKNCTNEENTKEACYIDKDENYIWGKIAKEKEYTKVSNINTEKECLSNNTIVANKSINIKLILIILIIIILIIILIMVYRYIKKK